MDKREMDALSARIALIGSRAMGAAVEAFATGDGQEMVELYRLAVVRIQSAIDHADEDLAVAGKLFKP